MCHYFHPDTLCLQAGDDRRYRELQPFAGSDNDDFRIEFANYLAVCGGQLIDTCRFPELNDIR